MSDPFARMQLPRTVMLKRDVGRSGYSGPGVDAGPCGCDGCTDVAGKETKTGIEIEKKDSTLKTCPDTLCSLSYEVNGDVSVNSVDSHLKNNAGVCLVSNDVCLSSCGPCISSICSLSEQHDKQGNHLLQAEAFDENMNVFLIQNKNIEPPNYDGFSRAYCAVVDPKCDAVDTHNTERETDASNVSYLSEIGSSAEASYSCGFPHQGNQQLHVLARDGPPMWTPLAMKETFLECPKCPVPQHLSINNLTTLSNGRTFFSHKGESGCDLCGRCESTCTAVKKESVPSMPTTFAVFTGHHLLQNKSSSNRESLEHQTRHMCDSVSNTQNLHSTTTASAFSKASSSDSRLSLEDLALFSSAPPCGFSTALDCHADVEVAAISLEACNMLADEPDPAAMPAPYPGGHCVMSSVGARPLEPVARTLDVGGHQHFCPVFPAEDNLQLRQQ